MRRITFLVVVLGLGCGGRPAPVLAPEPGDRVRVTAPDLGINRYMGRVSAVDDDTLTVDTLHLAFASVTGLDVFRGRKSFGAGKGAGLGFLIGAGGGAVIGALFGLSPNAQCAFENSGPCPGFLAAFGAVLGGVTGTLVGVVSGALIKTDRWVSFGPQRDGRFGFGASVRF